MFGRSSRNRTLLKSFGDSFVPRTQPIMWYLKVVHPIGNDPIFMAFQTIANPSQLQMQNGLICTLVRDEGSISQPVTNLFAGMYTLKHTR